MSSLDSGHCHLRESPRRLANLVLEDELHDSSHYGVWLSRCPDCGQRYAGCSVEVFDDSWSFYAPIDDAEAAKLRADYDRVKELIQSKSHIVWPPRFPCEPTMTPVGTRGGRMRSPWGPRPW
jgi:hypothetical protein